MKAHPYFILQNSIPSPLLHVLCKKVYRIEMCSLPTLFWQNKLSVSKLLSYNLLLMSGLSTLHYKILSHTQYFARGIQLVFSWSYLDRAVPFLLKVNTVIYASSKIQSHSLVTITYTKIIHRNFQGVPWLKIMNYFILYHPKCNVTKKSSKTNSKKTNKKDLFKARYLFYWNACTNNILN